MSKLCMKSTTYVSRINHSFKLFNLLHLSIVTKILHQFYYDHLKLNFKLVWFYILHLYLIIIRIRFCTKIEKSWKFVIYFFSFLLRDNFAMINDQITIHPCQTSKFQRQRPSFEIIFHLSISDKRKRDLFSCTDKMNYLYENWAMSKRCFLSLSPFVIPGSWSIERRKEFPTTLFPIRRPYLPCLLTK